MLRRPDDAHTFVDQGLCHGQADALLAPVTTQSCR